MHDERRHLSYTAAKHIASSHGIRLIQIKPLICLVCPSFTDYELGAILLEHIESRSELGELLIELRHGDMGNL